MNQTYDVKLTRHRGKTGTKIPSIRDNFKPMLQIYLSIEVTCLEVDAHAHAMFCQRHLMLI